MTTIHTTEVTDLMLRKSTDLIDGEGMQRCERLACSNTFEPQIGRRWCEDKCGLHYRKAKADEARARELIAVDQDIERFAAFEAGARTDVDAPVMVIGAKIYLDNEADIGASCPCCGQHVQRYRRTINAASAAMLILAHGRHGMRPFHQPALEKWAGFTAGDWAKLRYWNLIEERDELVDDDHKPRAGWWAVTIEGVRFLEGRATAPRYTIVFDGQPLRHEGEDIGIEHALGTRYDYRELRRRSG